MVARGPLEQRIDCSGVYIPKIDLWWKIRRAGVSVLAMPARNHFQSVAGRKNLRWDFLISIQARAEGSEIFCKSR
jgi:hypothetical protein